MSIRVSKMNAINLGPIKKINLEFSDINLVYGLNESGKTFLVEFLLSSLFKESKLFTLRDVQFTGQLEVAGLNKKPVVFSPDPKSKKLEDYFSDTRAELPKDLCKLLVVRAGELSFENTQEGVSETILKKYLSNEFVLDQIGANCSPTIQNSRFVDGEINGKRQGENKKRIDKESDLRSARDLLEEVDRSYSEGEIQILNNQLEIINQLYLEKQEDRCKLAFQLNEETKMNASKIDGLKKELNRKISLLSLLVQDLNNKTREVTASEKSILAHLKNEINMLQNQIIFEEENIGKISYALNEKTRNLKQKQEKVNLPVIEAISSQVKNYEEIKNRIHTGETEKQALEAQLQPLEWLNNAIETYQQCLGNKSEKELNKKLWNSWPLTLLATSAIFVAIILLLNNVNIYMVRLIGIVALFFIGLLMFGNALIERRAKQILNEAMLSGANLKEIDAIRQRFSEMFGIAINRTDLPAMRMKRDELRGIEIKYKSTENEVSHLAKKQDEIQHRIAAALQQLNSKATSPADWEAAINDLRVQANDLRTEYIRYNTFYERVSGLNQQIPSTDYQDYKLEEIQVLFDISDKRINEFQSKIDNRNSFIKRYVHESEELPFVESAGISNLEEWQNKFDALSETRQQLDRQGKIIESFIAEHQESQAVEDEYNLRSVSIDFEVVKTEIKNIKDAIRENENQNTKLLLELSKIGVLEKDFIIPLANEIIDFDIVEFKEIEAEQENVLRNIEQEKRKLDNLRMKLVGAVAGKVSDTFEELVDKLKQKEQTDLAELNKLNAQMIAGIIVTDVLAGLAGDERENIKTTLNSPQVSDPLWKLTGRYKKYVLEDNGLSVNDDYATFPLKDISTGTREQILLSLRLGFAANLMKSDQMFIILDDAFQHSDWNRREYLINHMFDLATEGWQIIYFTMDNHIKSLFDNFSNNYSCQYTAANLSE